MNKNRVIKKINCDLCGEEMKADKKIEHLAKKHKDKKALAILEELEQL